MNIYPILKDGIEIAMERQIYLARRTAQCLADNLNTTIILNGGREYGIETFNPTVYKQISPQPSKLEWWEEQYSNE